MKTEVIQRKCRYCGNPFIVDEEAGLFFYCSFECWEKAKAEAKRKRKEAAQRVQKSLKRMKEAGMYDKKVRCEVCGREFITSHPHQKYCSPLCRAIASDWKAVGFYVFWRDRFRCRYCGRSPADGVKLVVDHIYPRSRTREISTVNHPINLVTACEICNTHKSSTLFDEQLIWEIWQQNLALAKARPARDFRRLFGQFIYEHSKTDGEELSYLEALLKWETFCKELQTEIRKTMLDTTELAEELGVTRQTIWRWIAQGKLKPDAVQRLRSRKVYLFKRNKVAKAWEIARTNHPGRPPGKRSSVCSPSV